MKAVITRVSDASVTIEEKVAGAIKQGLLVLLGIAPFDNERDAERLAEKIINLRIFSDENDKMNLSLLDIKGEILVVSQFTLYADTKSRRPGFSNAAPPSLAEPLYEHFLQSLAKHGVSPQHGEFGAKMAVRSTNDGPVTIILNLP